MGWFGWIPRAVKNHGSLILSILAGGGVVGTAVASALAAPEAEEKLYRYLREKVDDRKYEIMDRMIDDGHPVSFSGQEHADIYKQADSEVKLTLGEKIRIAGPDYIPAALLGLGTMACIAGAHVLNMRQQAALLSAYLLLQQDFGAYRQEIRDEYGAEADRKALEESRKKIKMLEADVKRLEAIKGIQVYGIATLPGVVFKSDMANIDRAFLHFNRNLILRGYGDLKELYSFLGLSEDWGMFDTAPDEEFGWNAYENETVFGCSFLDYRLEEVKTDDGVSSYLITFDIPPYRIDGEYPADQADTDVREEDYYEGYLPGKAAQLMRSGLEKVPVLIDSASNSVWTPPCF